MYTFDGEEMIHSFDADGASLGSRPFEAFDYNCFASWFGEPTLLQRGSNAGATDATLITISDTAENATPSPGHEFLPFGDERSNGHAITAGP